MLNLYLGPRTVTNFNDPLMGYILQNDTPFHLENNRYNIVTRIEDADIIPVMVDHSKIDIQLEVLRNKSKHSFILLMLHTHLSETYSNRTLDFFIKPYKEITDNIIIVGTSWIINHPNQIFYDFYLNHNKALFFDYRELKMDLFKEQRLWVSNNTLRSYRIPKIEKYFPTKKFLIPNNIRPHSHEFKEVARTKIRKYLCDDESYFSNTTEGIFLKPEEDGLERAYTNQGVGCIPIANSYYLDTIMSVFSETIGTATAISDGLGYMGPTEKTFVPLIKGHLILPFSGSKFIQHLINKYGIKFPNWIDINFDLIENDTLRLKEYMKVALDLKRKSLAELTEMLNDSLDIRVHNREQIRSLPYDSLYDKLRERTGL